MVCDLDVKKKLENARYDLGRVLMIGRFLRSFEMNDFYDLRLKGLIYHVDI